MVRAGCDTDTDGWEVQGSSRPGIAAAAAAAGSQLWVLACARQCTVRLTSNEQVVREEGAVVVCQADWIAVQVQELE